MTEAIRQGDIPGVQLRCRRALPLDPDALWRWLVEPALAGRWMAARVHAVGDGLALERRGAGGPIHERARPLERRRPALWVLAFEELESGWPSPTRLTFEIGPRPGGCELSILHEGFEHLPLSDCLTIWEGYRRRWRRALDRLESAVGGTPSRP